MTSFGLPISSQGVPGAPSASNFGQPSGVAYGPASGGYGSVSSTHPGNTYQNTVDTKSNVRFQVRKIFIFFIFFIFFYIFLKKYFCTGSASGDYSS